MPYELPTSVDAPLLIHGDCLDELPKLAANSVDAFVSDPPAGIAFMQSPGGEGSWDSFTNYEPRTERGHEGPLRRCVECAGGGRERGDHPLLHLMRWLIRLVCPVGGVVLSTFGGSGTDAVSAIAEGMRIIIMERRRDYFELMCSRVAAAIGSPDAAAEANTTAPIGAQLGLL